MSSVHPAARSVERSSEGSPRAETRIQQEGPARRSPGRTQGGAVTRSGDRTDDGRVVWSGGRRVEAATGTGGRRRREERLHAGELGGVRGLRGRGKKRRRAVWFGGGCRLQSRCSAKFQYLPVEHVQLAQSMVQILFKVSHVRKIQHMQYSIQCSNTVQYVYNTYSSVLYSRQKNTTHTVNGDLRVRKF